MLLQLAFWQILSESISTDQNVRRSKTKIQFYPNLISKKTGVITNFASWKGIWKQVLSY